MDNKHRSGKVQICEIDHKFKISNNRFIIFKMLGTRILEAGYEIRNLITAYRYRYVNETFNVFKNSNPNMGYPYPIYIKPIIHMVEDKPSNCTDSCYNSIILRRIMDEEL